MGGVFGEVRGVEAAGVAREFVSPCSKRGIGQAARRASREPTRKCWGKDKVADTPPKQQGNSCRGKRKSMCATKMYIYRYTYGNMPEGHMAV